MKKKIVKMQLAELKENFVVRIELDRPHVEHLKDLIGTGVEMDPLLVSEDDNELIDGRHRKAAYLELEFKEVECEIRTFASQAEKIIAALRANVGGSLPPTHADVNHTMQILLTCGESRKSIIEMVSTSIGFPAKLVQRHLDEVQSNMAYSRLKKAARAVVSGGKTVHEAAAEQGIKLENLMQHLEVDGKAGDDRATSVRQVKSYFSTSYNSFSCSQGQTLSKVLRDLKDGIITPEESQDVIEHIKKLAVRFNRHHEEWVHRFASHIGTTVKAAEVAKTTARKRRVSRADEALEHMGVA